MYNGYTSYGDHEMNSFMMGHHTDDLSDDIQISSPSPPGRTRNYIQNYEFDDIVDEKDWIDYQPQDSGELSSQNSIDRALEEYENDEYSESRQNAIACLYAPPSFANNTWLPFQSHNRRADMRQMRPISEYKPSFPAQTHRAVSPPAFPNQGHPPIERGEEPRNAHGVRLRPVSELSDMYRSVFKFGVFNAVQSTCFDSIMNSNKNLVISAPTGAGKTVLFELAIIRLLNGGSDRRGIKCVYIAPTKALCSERNKDWIAKFDPLGAKSCELTGDTVQFGRDAWGDARGANIIITTVASIFDPLSEKWDSLTRNWSDHEMILSQVQLVLVDEVHILNETRGATLEVVISRMKARSKGRVRFVLVSATVPNINDVADWIGSGGGIENTSPAMVFQFDESYRPCKLTRHVYGYHRPKGQNDFMFSRTLDYKLFEVLTIHTVGKPALVFCPTRKGVLATAEQLMKQYKDASEKKEKLPWVQPPRIDHNFDDKRINELAAVGIGVHHAGLSLDDRRAIEDLFLKMVLKAVIATSTLAVGVNLPAHTVVIKGVHAFCNNSSHEYSDLEVMQMLGRAGRPQFDKEGIGIIMCEKQLEEKYKALTQGETILESCLHLNLAEHLNSEIGLGTISSFESAKTWLMSSFMFRRFQKNSEHYKTSFGGDSEKRNITWEEKIGEMVTDSVKKLQDSGLIVQRDRNGPVCGKLVSTEYGDIMSKYYIKLSTMNSILKIPARTTLRELLELICASEELNDLKLRSSEKAVYNKLREHFDIRFTIKKVEKASDKVFLLVQSVLAGISLRAPEYKAQDSQPHLEAQTVFRHVPRIARAVAEVAIVKRNGSQLKYGMELVRCLNAKAWEDRSVVLKQIPQIGEVSLKVLACAGITTLAGLRREDPGRIELLLNRRPPFGHEIISCAKEFPEYSLRVRELGVRCNGGRDPVEVDLSIECGLAAEYSKIVKLKKQLGRKANMTAVLTITSDFEFIDFRRIPTKSLQTPRVFETTAILMKPSQSIIMSMTSEIFAGVFALETYKPSLDARQFPTPNTRPLNSLDADLAGLEDIPDFWNVAIDDEDEGSKTASHKCSGKTISVQTEGRLCESDLVEDRPSSRKEKLANGNYQCNHSCKDKTKCRHLCCREGLPEHPRKRRNNSSEINGGHSKSSNPRRVEVTDKKVQAKKAVDRSNKQLEQLKSLHERSNSSLKLSETGRLRLSGDSSQRKPRILPSFDLELTDLCSSGLPDPSVGSSEDEDKLPEPLCLVKNNKDPDEKRATSISLEPCYSDPELDALIRDLPLENHAQGLQSTSSPRPATDPVIVLSKEPPEASTKTSLLKRHMTTIGEAPVAKRLRYFSHSGDVDDGVLTESSGSRNLISLPKTSYKQNYSKRQDDSSEPLFLSSPEQNVSKILYEHTFYEGDFDFDLPTPETWSRSTVGQTDEPLEIRSHEQQQLLSDEASHVCLPRDQISDCPRTNNLEIWSRDTDFDPIADFEAWLLQGGVVVAE